MKHNHFGKKATLGMVTLENFVPSPWKDDKLSLKGEHMDLL